MIYMLKLLVRLMKDADKPKVAAKKQPVRLHKPLSTPTSYSDRPYGSVKYLEDM